MDHSQREKVKAFLYDDMCHLKPYVEKESQKSQSKATELFAKMDKAVDKLHFRGHRGAYCQKECDPYKLKYLENVNTPVCEQTFSWINRFKNCRNMTGPRFFMYFAYIIDMRNNDKESNLRKVLHPNSAERFAPGDVSPDTKPLYMNITKSLEKESTVSEFEDKESEKSVKTVTFKKIDNNAEKR